MLRFKQILHFSSKVIELKHFENIQLLCINLLPSKNWKKSLVSSVSIDFGLTPDHTFIEGHSLHIWEVFTKY